mgnify:FL=1
MKRKTHWLLAVPALVLAAGLAVTFLGWGREPETHRHGDETWEKTRTFAEVPAFLANYPERTRQIYASIGENAHILRELDCYCGCMELETDPHDSLLRCYVAEAGEDGVTWTDHAVFCGLCLEQAAAVAEWSKEGKTLEEIRQLTVETFKPAV